MHEWRVVHPEHPIVYTDGRADPGRKFVGKAYKECRACGMRTSLQDPPSHTCRGVKGPYPLWLMASGAHITETPAITSRQVGEIFEYAMGGSEPGMLVNGRFE